MKFHYFFVSISDCGSGETNTRQMFSALVKGAGVPSTDIYKCNHCDILTESKFEITQHLSAMHPQNSEYDFQVISPNANSRWSSDEMNLLTAAGRNATSTPTDKEDDMKSDRMDAENSEEDFNMGGNDMDVMDPMNADSGDFTVLCPLCQDQFVDKKSLEKHVMSVHFVNSDGLARLLNLVDTSHWLNSNNGNSGSSSSGNPAMMLATNKIGKSPGSSASSCADSSDIECVTCGTTFKSMFELFSHAQESQHFQLTGNQNEYTCILRVCQQSFSTINGMCNHFKDVHMNAVISERHVYKYRCKSCSLAYKTQEKLNEHSLYHTMRDATKCHLCTRSFRSMTSLQKHMDQMHRGNNTGVPSTSSPITSPNLNKSSEYIDDYPNAASPASSTRQDDSEIMEMQRSSSVAADDQSSISTEVISETTDLDEYLNSQTVAEEGFNDPSRKFKCTKCKMGFTHKNYLQQHYKSNLHRRNADKMTNYPLEKYLDPNRPFKCETCRESFTQKNILLVHYNSVSHLHKKKQSECITPSTSPTIAATNASSSSALEFDRRSVEFDRKSADFDRKSIEFNENDGDTQKRKCCPDNDYDSPKKRFKCDICKVAYPQGSSLDIHMRSVKHQTRACRLQEQHQMQQFQNQLQQLQQTSPNNSQFSSLSPTPSNMSGTGNADLNESAVNALKAANSPKFANNPIYKTLLENFGFDIVKQFNEINKNQGGDAAQRLAANPALSNFLLNEAATNPNMNLAQTLGASLNASNSGNAEKYFCRHCKKTFSSVFVLKSHCEEVHNEKVPLEFLEKFAEKFKNYYLEGGDGAMSNVDGSDSEILDFSAKKSGAEASKLKADASLAQPLAASSPALSKLAEQSQQALQLEHLSQQLNIDPATLAQKMMEQNLAAAANFPQAFGMPGGLQGLQGLQNLQNLQGLPGKNIFKLKYSLQA